MAGWNAAADKFDLAADHGLLDPAVRAAWRQLLLQHLPEPPARILDLGCGTGTLSVLLAQNGYQVHGIDFSPEMIRRAEQKAVGIEGITLQVVDESDPPAEPGPYDVVLCRHVLWAMPDPAVALRNWTRLLEPDGSLMLVEGSWSTGVGLAAEETIALLRAASRGARLSPLDDPIFWAGPITDERYLIVSPPS